MSEKVLVTRTKYVEVEEKMNDKTSVWHYFLRNEDTNLGKCKDPLCQAILKSAGGSTTGLSSHLRTKHRIDLRNMKKNVAEADTTPTEGKASTYMIGWSWKLNDL